MRQAMSKMYRIEEDDLAELERTLPAIADAMLIHMNPRLATQFRRVQKILSDVRWSYGPPSHVERVDVPPEDESYLDS